MIPVYIKVSINNIHNNNNNANNSGSNDNKNKIKMIMMIIILASFTMYVYIWKENLIYNIIYIIYICKLILPVNAIVTLPHPRGEYYSTLVKTLLAPSADKQNCNCDSECSNHHPSLSTLRSKGLSHSKIRIGWHSSLE